MGFPIPRHLTTFPPHQSHPPHTTTRLPCHFHPQGSCAHQRRPHRPCWQRHKHSTTSPLPPEHTPLSQLPWLFCPGRTHRPRPKPRPWRICSHYSQHLATRQKHPFPHPHAPRVGRRHKIHFWRRGIRHDPAERAPRSCLSPERQMLGHPPRPRHCQRTGLVHQRHSTGSMTFPLSTTTQPPLPTFVSPDHTQFRHQQQNTTCVWAAASQFHFA